MIQWTLLLPSPLARFNPSQARPHEIRDSCGGGISNCIYLNFFTDQFPVKYGKYTYFYLVIRVDF